MDTMYDNGVDLLLSGDAHNYERFAGQTPTGKTRQDQRHHPDRRRNGRRPLHRLEHPRSRTSLVAKAEIFGVLRLTLQTDSYKWKYLADPSTPFNDSGSKACH